MSFKSDATYYFHITKCPSLFTRVFGFDSEKLSKWQFFGVKTFLHFVLNADGTNEILNADGVDGADGANRT